MRRASASLIQTTLPLEGERGGGLSLLERDQLAGLPLLEVCCGSLYSVEQAALGGARRIEFCRDLPLDGLTPDLTLIRSVHERFPDLTLHVLIRSVDGPFVYDDSAVKQMEHEVREAVRAGADAVVVGALTADGDIDLDATRRWIDAADGHPVTFHRAFDCCRRPLEALEQLIALGCTRILTSGQQPTAEAGIPLLRQLVTQSSGRIIILAGGGVNHSNARRILDATGTTEIHGSASRLMPDGRKETDAVEVQAILQTITSHINPNTTAT